MESSNTGYKCIRFDKKIGKFEVYIAYRVNLNYGNNNTKSVMRKHYIGSYDSLNEAIYQR